MKKITAILGTLLLVSISHARDLAQERALQERIQQSIWRTVERTIQPPPGSSIKAQRIYRNRYRNQHPPIFPKTIYREPQRPPMPRYHSRFFGGIPRG